MKSIELFVLETVSVGVSFEIQGHVDVGHGLGVVEQVCALDFLARILEQKVGGVLQREQGRKGGPAEFVAERVVHVFRGD